MEDKIIKGKGVYIFSSLILNVLFMSFISLFIIDEHNAMFHNTYEIIKFLFI